MTSTPDTIKSAGVRYPIGAKLVLIISVLLLLSLGAITVLVSVMVSGDLRVTAEDTNFNVNLRSAAEAESALERVRSGVLLLLDTMDSLAPSQEGNLRPSAPGRPGVSAPARNAAELFFRRNRDIAAIVPAAIMPADGGPALLNDAFFAANGLDAEYISDFTASRQDAFRRCAEGETLLQNAAPVFGLPLLALFLPREGGGYLVHFSPESLAGSFGAGSNLSFLVNDAGDILVHPDDSLVMAGENAAAAPFVKTMRESGEGNLQTRYTGEDGRDYFGAFRKLSLANAAVITNAEDGVVCEGIAATTRRNIYLTGAVLCIAVLCIWFFSASISGPLKNLSAAAGRIKEGEFELDLKAKTRDEIGLLTESFVEMGKGLAERERLRDTFGRFTNATIAEQAMKGELALGGETKRVTVFFSDIRSFTAISEKLEPSEVVEFLNDYMTRMVDCVDKTGGVVDKFIGDAVMAVWGAPLSAGTPAQDAFNCVKAALMMRAALYRFNQGRGGNKKPVIKIGCGINTGDVVAGQIGSSRRMEYTVIGDAVNLASRTEALNKPLGTDILITENTCALIGKYLITEEMPSISVKGKEKPVRMFAVVNMRTSGETVKGPENLAELRRILGTRAPDLGKVDINGEEKKYHIQGN
ncbi:MAG: HAMP domain-containing protein [Treponema sp.]|jgi:adenylate cyclase|nr:HAMP domain-containing protein [Treponema sp.]